MHTHQLLSHIHTYTYTCIHTSCFHTYTRHTYTCIHTSCFHTYTRHTYTYIHTSCFHTHTHTSHTYIHTHLFALLFQVCAVGCTPSFKGGWATSVCIFRYSPLPSWIVAMAGGCMYVCMYVSEYVFVSILYGWRLYVFMYCKYQLCAAYLRVKIFLCVCISKEVRVYTYIYELLYKYIYIYVCVCMCFEVFSPFPSRIVSVAGRCMYLLP
jgi:hypothetical protein